MFGDSFECENNQDCGENAHCNPNTGVLLVYECECDLGYRGDGFSCILESEWRGKFMIIINLCWIRIECY